MQTTSGKVTASKGTIILALSSKDHILLKDGTNEPTGYYLNEMAIPMMAAVDAGYEIVLGTPEGNKPWMDPLSAVTANFEGSEDGLKKALDFVANYPAMQKPVTLHSLVENGLDEYVGVFVPGGHPPMTDLMEDPSLGAILRHCHEHEKVSCFLCHGPISIAAAIPEAKAFRAAMVAGDVEAAKKAAAGWQYAGYRMTIFSNDEEHYVENTRFRGHLAPFYVADALEIAGGKIEKAVGGIFKPLVVQDRELITGQNPPTAPELAGVLVKALDRYTVQVAV